MEKINVRNIYIELLNKIKNVQGVDKDYVDGLIELVDDEITALDSDINAITSVIPDTASITNQLATAEDIPDVTQIQLDLETLTASVSAIDLLIPSGASSSNQLATADDIPIIPTVINPVYIEYTLDSSNWSLIDGAYHQGYDITPNIIENIPPFVFVVPLSGNTATASEESAFNLIDYTAFTRPFSSSHIEIVAGSEPSVTFKIGVIAYRNA